MYLYIMKNNNNNILQRPSFIQQKKQQQAVKSKFSLKRPGFRPGNMNNEIKDEEVQMLSPNDRTGTGNRTITRTNFLAPQIKARQIISFEKLQARDIAEGGIKVQLGDKTLERLFKIQVDDPQDKSWIDEKNKRLKAGESEKDILEKPPFGRPQRKINKMSNLGMIGLGLNDKIEGISSALSQGNLGTKEELTQITAQIMEIVSNQENLENMSTNVFWTVNKKHSRIKYKSYLYISIIWIR